MPKGTDKEPTEVAVAPAKETDAKVEPKPTKPVVKVVRFLRDILNQSQAHKDQYEIEWDGVSPFLFIRPKSLLQDGSKQLKRVVGMGNVLYMELEGE